MEEGLEALVEIKSHQRECAIRYENIEKRRMKDQLSLKNSKCFCGACIHLS